MSLNGIYLSPDQNPVAMANCAHQQWLRVQQEDNGFILQYSGRLHQISASLPHPDRQYPSLLFFIGKQCKTRALRVLFPANSISNCRKYGIANICIHAPTSTSDNPILIADSCPDYTQVKLRGARADCHETSSYPITWLGEGQMQQPEGLISHVLSRMLSLFMDVVCIFAQDCGGLDAVAESIVAWIARGSASTLPSIIRPRLLVVSSTPREIFDTEALRFRLKLVSEPDFSNSFASINVINVLGMQNPSPEIFGVLENVLHEETRMARGDRTDSQTLFSILHMAAFFDKALRHFSTSFQAPFDFITASRQDNPVSLALQHHLASFLRMCRQHCISSNIMWDFIASVIVLDSYPPDMHRGSTSSRLAQR